VGGPSQRLSPVPGGEGIGRKSRVDQAEMRFEEDMVEIVVIFVNLTRAELTLVDDNLVG
jgi:hypothetical protein